MGGIRSRGGFPVRIFGVAGTRQGKKRERVKGGFIFGIKRRKEGKIQRQEIGKGDSDT